MYGAIRKELVIMNRAEIHGDPEYSRFKKRKEDHVP